MLTRKKAGMNPDTVSKAFDRYLAMNVQVKDPSRMAMLVPAMVSECEKVTEKKIYKRRELSEE